MSRSRRIVCLLLLGVPLAATALYLGGAERPGDERSGASAHPDAASRVFDSIRASHRHGQVAQARRESPAGAPDHGRRRGDLAALAEQAELAEPVARRFFSAFSRYELGELDGWVRARLRATASAGFAGELIAAPPRATAEAEGPPRARLGALEFVPGAVDPRRERLLSAELVGEIKRGAERSAIAIELVRERRGWRVGGLGR